MSDTISKCPSCHTPLATPAEMAAHVCPGPDPDQKTLDQALVESRNNALKRKLIKPTAERLRSDAASAAQQLHDFWDGDVEVFVILRAKEGGTVAGRGTFTEVEKLRRVLAGLLLRVGDLTKQGVKA